VGGGGVKKEVDEEVVKEVTTPKERPTLVTPTSYQSQRPSLLSPLPSQQDFV
jgi:DTW domain-containing protein YfiP